MTLDGGQSWTIISPDLTTSDKSKHVKLRFLANDIGKSDFPPIRQQPKVHEMFTEQQADYTSHPHELIGQDVSAFDRLLKEDNIPPILSGVD